MSQLNKVLRAVHPAQLNVALTNISQGLQAGAPRSARSSPGWTRT